MLFRGIRHHAIKRASLVIWYVLTATMIEINGYECGCMHMDATYELANGALALLAAGAVERMACHGQLSDLPAPGQAARLQGSPTDTEELPQPWQNLRKKGANVATVLR